MSCGYDCDIEDCDSPEQKHIRGNHIALCEHGRAGIAHIVDSVQRKNDEESTYTEVTKNLEKEADKDMKWLDTVIGEKKEEIKDYVPFPKKDALNKSNGLEEIKRIINNKDNIFEDTEGMIYLTQKAYNDIKVVIKIYGITQKELEGISKYFFGPGGYNSFCP